MSDVMSQLQALEVSTQPQVLEPLLEQLPGQSQAKVQNPAPAIKQERDEIIDIVRFEAVNDETHEHKVKEVIVTQRNTVDLYVNPIAQIGDLPKPGFPSLTQKMTRTQMSMSCQLFTVLTLRTR